MRIRQIGSAVGKADGHQNLTSFLINDVIAIDAGCLGYLSPVEDQLAVKHVFLSHSHIDHVGSLPCFLDNVYQPGADCPTLYASKSVLESLRRDFFNDRIWPNLERIAETGTFFQTRELSSESPVSVAGLKITPIDVNHVVPTHGFLVQEPLGKSVLFVSDSGPTDRIWEVANAIPGLHTVFLECSFPDSMQELALKTKHLSPALFQREVAKLHRQVQVVAVHIKTGFHEKVIRELQQLGLQNLQIGGGDHVWEIC